MKKTFIIIFSLSLLFCAAVAGFFIGKENAQHESRRFMEGLSRSWLSNDLLALIFIEQGKMQEAKQLLQAGTNGHLNFIIYFDTADYTPEETQDRCRLLNTLKQYRAKHQSSYAEMLDSWNMPEMREEEDERQRYLDQLGCPDIFLFKIE